MLFDTGRGHSYHGAGMDIKSLGKIIQAWRLASDLSQLQLAAKTELSRKVISGIETGTRKFKLGELVRICRALDKPLEKLVQVWMQGFLAELQQVERELYGEASPASKLAQTVPAAAPEPEWGLSEAQKKAVDKLADQIRDGFLEVLQESREDLLRSVDQMIARAAFPPPPSLPAHRPRSRVSRKGRVKPRE